MSGFYYNLSAKISDRMATVINIVNLLFTGMVYAAYILLIISMISDRNKDVIRVILVTGISFILVSVFRRLWNRKRPYIKYGYTPIIDKKAAGNSMPSRHVFSAFVIGMTFFYSCEGVVLGMAVIIDGIVLAFVRVIGGAHYISDVVVGAFIGIAAGIIGYYII